MLLGRVIETPTPISEKNEDPASKAFECESVSKFIDIHDYVYLWNLLKEDVKK